MNPPDRRWWATPAAIFLWWIGALWMVPMMLSMMVLSAVLGARRIEPISRLYCRGQIWLTGSRYTAVVHPKVDPATSFLFAQNHTNIFDHVVLYPATPHFKQGLELAEHFRIPVYGWFMKARGTIPVKKGSAGQTPEILAHMRSEIAKNGSILAFPEGHRTLDGCIRPLRKGVFFIARDLGLPVVPVTVCGMWAVQRKGDWRIHPGWTVTVYCDEPIPTEGLRDEDIPALAAQVQQVMEGRVNAWAAEHGLPLHSS